jgi:hypothetical protein
VNLFIITIRIRNNSRRKAMKKSMLVTIVGLIFALALTGCNYPGQETPESQVDLLNTAAAQTIQAQQTLIAQATDVPPQAATPTATLPPLDDTEVAPQPSSTPMIAATPTITPTPTKEIKCDQAAFVSETIPDGTTFNQGQAFTKTWTLKNNGSCTWDANYHVVFFSGNAMGAPAAKQLTSGTVAPGESVTITLELQAPNTSGTHRGDFKLRNGGGVLFGIGPRTQPFGSKSASRGTNMTSPPITVRLASNGPAAQASFPVPAHLVRIRAGSSCLKNPSWKTWPSMTNPACRCIPKMWTMDGFAVLSHNSP